MYIPVLLHNSFCIPMFLEDHDDTDFSSFFQPTTAPQAKKISATTLSNLATHGFTVTGTPVWFTSIIATTDFALTPRQNPAA